MKESFANGKLSYFWLVDYSNRSRWTPFHDESSYSQDGDRGFVGFTPMFLGEQTVLESGLIDLGKAKDPVLSFYYKTHQNSEDVFKIWVSKEYGKADTIATVNLQECELRKWIKVELPLKQFVGSKFIQIAFDCTGTTTTSNLYLDNINIFDRKTNDLEAKLKEAPTRLRVDNPASFVVEVMNHGTKPANDYTVAVYHGDKQMASVKGAAVAAGGTVENIVTFTPQRNLADTLKLYAKVEVEAVIPELDQVADILVADRIALEVQCSPLSKTRLWQRTKQYQQAGYQVLWLLGEKLWLKKTLTPLQKHFLYFSQNMGFHLWELDEKRSLLRLK